MPPPRRSGHQKTTRGNPDLVTPRGGGDQAAACGFWLDSGSMSGAAGKAPSSVAAPPQGNVPHQPLPITLQSGASPPRPPPPFRAPAASTTFRRPPLCTCECARPHLLSAPCLKIRAVCHARGGGRARVVAAGESSLPPPASSPTQTSVRGGEMKMDGKPELEGSLWGAYMCSLVGNRF